MINPAQAAAPTRAWIFGLPIDCVSMRQAILMIDRGLEADGQLIFATPNVNFLAEANRDAAFADAVLRSDAFFADGAPLLWLARLLGLRLPERVAGSDLFENLRRSSGEPIRVFFFGGDPGVAKAAHEAVTSDPGRFISAGYLDPGFGSAEQLSSDEVVSTINAAKADFLVVSLGARKGHLWIERNRERLNCRVISHLGAVVAFAAGHVRRAPPLVARFGFEWLWRTIAEPRLATRYLRDGVFLAGTLALATRNAIANRIRRAARAESAAHAVPGATTVSERIEIAGRLNAADLERLQRAVELWPADKAPTIWLEMNSVESVDPIAVGALHRLLGQRTLRQFRVACNKGSRGYRALSELRAQILVDFAERR